MKTGAARRVAVVGVFQAGADQATVPIWLSCGLVFVMLGILEREFVHCYLNGMQLLDQWPVSLWGFGLVARKEYGFLTALKRLLAAASDIGYQPEKEHLVPCSVTAYILGN